jgi:ParB-like chromosome segregation protein Spo0J
VTGTLRGEYRSLPDSSYSQTVIRGPVTTVPVSSVRPADSPRLAGEDDAHTRALAETDARLPPILVHRKTMCVVDGMHRLRATLLRGQQEIEVQFIECDAEDIFVLAVETNTYHGLPLSLKDREAAADRILRTKAHWSDRVIAQITGLAARTVASIRSRATADLPRLDARIGRDGKVRPVSSEVGRLVASEIIASRPEASLREIARLSGISVGTVRDVRERCHAEGAPKAVAPHRLLGPCGPWPRRRIPPRCSGICRTTRRSVSPTPGVHCCNGSRCVRSPRKTGNIWSTSFRSTARRSS